jgi:hypothetical protein
MEKQFKVIDGSYTSEVFETIEQAREDAQKCIKDESYNGCVVIVDAETGGEVETVDADEFGRRG